MSEKAGESTIPKELWVVITFSKIPIFVTRSREAALRRADPEQNDDAFPDDQVVRYVLADSEPGT